MNMVQVGGGSPRGMRSEREIREYLNRHEHDACALMAAARKDGVPAHAIVTDSLEALAKMVHRSGDVDGEGDGCGLQLDLPRSFWGALLSEEGQDPAHASHPRFAVGHFFIPRTEAYWAKTLKEQICHRLEIEGFQVLLQRSGKVNSEALGPRGQGDEPEFWQVACLAPGIEAGVGAFLTAAEAANQACYRMAITLEDETELHVLSFSSDTVVYKVRGDARVLEAYYPDLRDPRLESRMAIGHNRYSTNTSTIFERVQPFSVLGHNGEINTIRQLREQARQLGIPLTRGGSDSQDLNRTLDGLIHQFGITLFEAMEILFPPIIGEIKGMTLELQDLYMYYRQAWGPFAQGPAAIAARSGDYLVASVDAMGLRPFWLIETDESYFFSSEQGIVPIREMVRDPHPLAPGEKVGVLLRQGLQPELLSYTELQRRVLTLSRQRFPAPVDYRRHIEVGGPPGHSLPLQLAGAQSGTYRVVGRQARSGAIPQERLLSSMGWSGEDLQQVRAMSGSGAEPIGSLGYDGPLACLSEQRHNLADYFKESVAVVTNPAVDREREIEHFSTRTVLGARPPVAMLPGWRDRSPLSAVRVELRMPLVLGGHRVDCAIGRGQYRDLARAAGTYLLEDLLAEFDPLGGAGDDPGVVRAVHTTFAPTESLAQALSRLARQAVQSVSEGAQLILIDDSLAFAEGNLFIDPHLVLSAVDQALKQAVLPEGATNLRRRCSLLLRSGALRSLHDIALAIGLGADAVNPYLMLEVAAEGESAQQGLENLSAALTKGLEKVISTLGIHELRGYARCFSHIGLKPEVARYFGTEGYAGSETAGLSLARLKADSGERYRVARGEGKGELTKSLHFWPRLWKAVSEAGQSPERYEEYLRKLQAQEKEMPVSLRHLLDFRAAGGGAAVDPSLVDTGVEDYRYPITISGMSFGSQGEIAFRAYAEAAKRLDIVCMNGEGGEIPDMVGRYFKWRGQQVASGRFGVHAEMLNGSRFIEIKVGQGAKPGEGGHLPGSKVSAKVARARNAIEGVDLISPSNNHDVYSIEDLAQLVEELKTTNPHAKIVVKIPVVPGIGTIAVGIAKSGADVVALCGYDGGTGAARKHALRHAGLPIEIGVREAHLALVAAGIRDRVEIWGDSGIKSGHDVVKLMLLGANRVGFATMAMVAIGCTICRGCQLDTCHVGIATQMETLDEAREKGLKSFVPRVYDDAVERLVTLFAAVGEEVRRLTARLGFARTQDLVGRAELMQQVRGIGRVDLAELTLPVAWETPGAVTLDRAPIRQCAPLTAVASVRLAASGEGVRVVEHGVTARDRMVGIHLAGDMARARVRGRVDGGSAGGSGVGEGGAVHGDEVPATQIELTGGSVAGNGLAAFSTEGVSVRVLGGAQDGVGKGMLGGTVIILKDQNRYGGYVGGSVGKSFGYGAQAGTFIVQGDADARCGIRLSGADLILGGNLKGPVDDSLGSLGTRANLKGFAFEYMTRGRAVVLGDPGPWICSGMTGGAVYVRLQPDLGLDEAAIRRRLAKGAKVHLSRIGVRGKKDLTDLLSLYHQVLLGAGQSDEACMVLSLMLEVERQFVAIIPITQQVDAAISTE